MNTISPGEVLLKIMQLGAGGGEYNCQTPKAKFFHCPCMHAVMVLKIRIRALKVGIWSRCSRAISASGLPGLTPSDGQDSGQWANH